MTIFLAFADKALRDEELTRAECHAVLRTSDEHILELLDAAFKVRERYFGRKVRLQMLLNAKSGACQEDCHYCSQSAVSTADIERYGLLPKHQMLEGGNAHLDAHFPLLDKLLRATMVKEPQTP